MLFLVPTVPLASQQTEVIKERLRLRVAEVTGKTTKWTAEWWRELLTQHDVLVGTGQVFLEAERHMRRSFRRAEESFIGGERDCSQVVSPIYTYICITIDYRLSISISTFFCIHPNLNIHEDPRRPQALVERAFLRLANLSLIIFDECGEPRCARI